MSKTNMRTLGQEVDDAVVGARTMLQTLERAMVSLGYKADGRLRIEARKRMNPTSGKSVRRSSYIRWKDGKILLSHDGSKSTPVEEMTAWQIMFVAHNLPYFLDELERNTRWLRDALINATAEIKRVIAKIRADPQPGPETE